MINYRAYQHDIHSHPIAPRNVSTDTKTNGIAGLPSIDLTRIKMVVVPSKKPGITIALFTTFVEF